MKIDLKYNQGPDKKTLFYDIETPLLKFLAFSTGKQYLNHKQLLPKQQYTGLITIQYCWNDGKPGKVLVVDPDNPKEAVEKFDKVASKADTIIGKNNYRFDDPLLQTQRLFLELPGQADWRFKSDDLESHLRRNFRLPSYSLDYVSDMVGLGGKIKMEFLDWYYIFCYTEVKRIESRAGKVAAKKVSELLYGMHYREVVKLGKEALHKMVGYGAKDAEDTRYVWNYGIQHFIPKHNRSIGISCRVCGSPRVSPHYVRRKGMTDYQHYFCREHNGYAGGHPVNEKKVKKLR